MLRDEPQRCRFAAALLFFSGHIPLSTAKTMGKGCDYMRYLFVILIAFMLCVCTHYAPPGENHPVRVVTQIDVTAIQDGKITQSSYCDTEKMEAVLQYLRKLKPLRHSPITPDTFRTDAYEIVLTMSDGSKNVYHQIYDSYIQKNNGPWQTIENSFGDYLPQLLQMIPSDRA